MSAGQKVSSEEREAFSKLRGEARELAIHRNDCPRFHEFFHKYALGSKVESSCFGCGRQAYHEQGITHLELPDIYLCKTCQAGIQEGRHIKIMVEALMYAEAALETMKIVMIQMADSKGTNLMQQALDKVKASLLR